MSISYKKLWVLLAQKEISKAELRRRLKISPSTFTKLNKNEYVALSIIVKMCKELKCDIGDICEVTTDDEKKG